MFLFHDKAGLKSALDKRFGTLTQASLDEAHELLTEELKKKWTLTTRSSHLAVLERALTLLQKGDAEAKVQYVSASADLQISKASGLVTYCALLLAIAAILLPNTAPGLQHDSLVTVLFVSLVGSAVTLCAIWFKWPKQDSELETPEQEYTWLLDLLVRRAGLINGAVLLSGIATAAMLVSMFIWVNAGSANTTVVEQLPGQQASSSSVASSANSAESITSAASNSRDSTNAKSSSISSRIKTGNSK